MLDINLFRVERGGNPDLIRESQRRRYADVTLVDQIIETDRQWRTTQHSLEQVNRINSE
jgi:seryl-tRNA synthetase